MLFQNHWKSLFAPSLLLFPACLTLLFLFLHLSSPRLSISCRLFETFGWLPSSSLFYDLRHVKTILEEFRDGMEEMSLHPLEQVALVGVHLKQFRREMRRSMLITTFFWCFCSTALMNNEFIFRRNLVSYFNGLFILAVKRKSIEAALCWKHFTGKVNIWTMSTLYACAVYTSLNLSW